MRTAFNVVIAVFALAATQVHAGDELRVPKVQSEPECEALMPKTGEVGTYFGTFELALADIRA